MGWLLLCIVSFVGICAAMALALNFAQRGVDDLRRDGIALTRDVFFSSKRIIRVLTLRRHH